MQQNEKKIQDVWIAIIEREIELFNCQFLSRLCVVGLKHTADPTLLVLRALHTPGKSSVYKLIFLNYLKMWIFSMC